MQLLPLAANGLYGSDGTGLILWPGAFNNTPYSFGISATTLWYSVPTGAIHAFYVGTTERLRINDAGDVGIGSTSPEVKLDVNGSLLVRAAALNSGGTSGVFFRNGYTTSNYYNCSILTYDHNADGWSDGLSINGWDGISFCIGSNTRNERMRINNSGNVGIGTNNPREKLDVYNGNVIIRSVKL